jgi:hypothetical protein
MSMLLKALRPSSRPSDDGLRRPALPRARVVAALVALLLSTTLAAAAAAGSSGSGTLGQDTNGAVNTDFTPVPVDGQSYGWKQFDGAQYPRRQAMKDSQTPITVDFFTVRFDPLLDKDRLAINEGFAGGAACDPSTAFEQLDSCTRYPSIWQFKDSNWQQVALPGGAGSADASRGYVGAISYMADGRVLAVGGDGCYPRREEPCAAGTGPPAGAADPIAGNARAWLYDGSSWREISGLGSQLQGLTDATEGAGKGQGEAPGGLSALDCSQPTDDRPTDVSGEYCVAGGLRQLWMWQGGGFVRSYDDKSTSGWTTALDDVTGPLTDTFLDGGGRTGQGPSTAAEFRFRVRDIRWVRRHPDPDGYASDSVRRYTSGNISDYSFVGVTAGCCAAGAQNAASTAGSRLLTFDGSSWSAWPINDTERLTANGSTSASVADSYYSVVVGQVKGGGTNSRLTVLGGVPDADAPDAQAYPLSVVASPGGSALAGAEPGSRIIIPSRQSVTGTNDSADNVDALNLRLGGVRLVSADGDFQRPQDSSGSPSNYAALTGNLDNLWATTEPDGLLDWAVGSLSSQCQSPTTLTDCQGVAYTTLRQTQLTPNPLTCTAASFDSTCGPKSEVTNGQYTQSVTSSKSQELMSLPSYGLNSITDVPHTAGGTIWAVGDKGAILRKGGNGSIGSPSEPPAPVLGSQQQTALADRSAYDVFRPSGLLGEAGVVPPLSAQPFGAPGPWGLSATVWPGGGLGSAAMSLDGSEGWAASGSSLYHFDGRGWTACVAGRSGADARCSSVDGLPKDVVFRVLARQSAEQGSGADDFQVMGITSDYRVALYRAGRWELMDGKGGRSNWAGDLGAGGVGIGDVVFGSPDDGWLAGSYADGLALYHFDGQEWVLCGSSDFFSTSSVTSYSHACGGSSVLPLFYGGLAGLSGIHLAVAGGRVYFAATRTFNAAHGTSLAFLAQRTQKAYPLIYHRDPGACSRPDDGSGASSGSAGCWREDFDPGCENRSDRTTEGCTGSADPSRSGRLTAISAVRLSSGRYVGWAAGTFGAASSPSAQDATYAHDKPEVGPRPGLLRLDSDLPGPRMWPGGDAIADYFVDPPAAAVRLVSVARPGGQEHDVLVPPPGGIGAQRFPLLHYEGDTNGQGRWRVLPTPFLTSQKIGKSNEQGELQALAPDGTGGFWLALITGEFYHYTDRQLVPVFSDVAHPIREPIAGTAVGGDGSFWVATQGSVVYRYDRVTGWDRMTISGWDSGRAVTNPSPAYAIAVGPGGSGVLVGRGGRIADVGPGGGVLDAASGVLCSATIDLPPCSTSYDLRAAAVGADGSAIVGGDHLALLWRPPGDGFRSIAKPPESSHDVTVTGLSMPSPGHAWLTTDVPGRLTETGQVFAGTLRVGCEGDPTKYCWEWKLETQGDGALRALALDPQGRGLAVGDSGLVLERQADGSWKRLDAGRSENFYSVALPPQGYGDGALIGGGVGVVLSRVNGRFELARPSDFFTGITHGAGLNHDESVGSSARIVGVAVLAGYRPGEVEAWAASQMPPQIERPGPWPGALLHYTNAPAGSLLDGGVGRARALPDTPPAEAGEVSFAAFGKQECQASPTCAEMQGTNLTNELIAREVASAIESQSSRAGGPAFALFTGDANTSAGRDQSLENGYVTEGGYAGYAANTPIDTDVIHHRWDDVIAHPLQEAGVGVFGALGVQDLSQTSVCGVQTGCPPGTRAFGNPGPSLGWREAFAQMNVPWGAGPCDANDPNKDAYSSHGLSFAPVCPSGVEGPSASVCPRDVRVADQEQDVPSGAAAAGQSASTCATPGADVYQSVPSQVGQALSGQGVQDQQVASESVPSQSVPAGGAHTHYAVDVKREGTAMVRLVVVDTSLRTLSGVAGTQNPVEEQLKWLTDVLSSRPAGERAVVVSETPSYSYGPGATTDTLTDSAVFEALMAREHVSAVVSGRLGWNGLYYTSTLAPGLHCPQQSGAYPDPNAGCDPTLGAGSGGSQVAQAVGSALGQTLAGGAVGAPPPNAALGAYPTVVAASAGGNFGPADYPGGPASGSADQGFWHGYSVIRVEPDGSVVVEQRPVLDWIGISAIAHDLRPGQHMTLHGYGREPVGTDQPIRYDDINSSAITHSFDLVRADPQQPWLPLTDPNSAAPNHYVPLGYASAGAQCTDPVACIDPQSGQISTGHGNHPRVYAIGILSVGDKAATWPIAFEPRRNYRAAATTIIPPLPLPAIHVAAAAAAAPPAAPPPPPPVVGTPGLPSLPALPSLPPLSASPPPAPPASPAAPPPPAFGQALPLSINPQLTPISITATVVPPSPPPVNPAPPSGSAARKEARQRQAAAAKSEEGADRQAQDAVGDLADQRPGATGIVQMTRRDRVKPGPSMIGLAHADQPSAWPRDLLYGGGLGLAALTFALGWLIVRPTPRRRSPDVPAPAWARRRS